MKLRNLDHELINELTIAEIETLCVLLDNGAYAAYHTEARNGGHAWSGEMVMDFGHEIYSIVGAIG